MKIVYFIPILLILLGLQEQSQQQLERNTHIVALEEAIKGKEQMPAEQVFQNIELFKGMPAARVLRIMEMAFSPALGVTCDFCHVEGKWESDDKDKKTIARKMWRMQREVSQQVREIVVRENAAVNCTTCHRGMTKPALEMPRASNKK